MSRVRVIDGNLEGSSMNLSEYDRDWLIENVNFVFHCAATIKFNEPLEAATKTNVQGTENVMALAMEMKNLKVNRPRWASKTIIIYIILSVK